MKHIITLLLVLLFASCSNNESTNENLEDDPNVFVFSNPQYYGTGSQLFDDFNLSIYGMHTLTFTISDEDNCTYYIFSNTFNFEGNKIPLDKIFSKMPIIDTIELKDKIGNIIFEFNPVANNTIVFNPDPLENLETRTYKGKVPKYFTESSNLTRSKLERTTSYETSINVTFVENIFSPE